MLQDMEESGTTGFRTQLRRSPHESVNEIVVVCRDREGAHLLLQRAEEADVVNASLFV
jgi:hypothetical protein